jgi:methylated-DNA-[protein]-cysteine S-methyltransferase
MSGIYARFFPVLDRAVQLGQAGEKVIAVSFPRETDGPADHPLLDRIADYLDGAAVDFSDVDVGLTVPTKQRAVLEALRAVPYGDEVSLELLARMSTGVDHEADLDIVRDALRNNPLPLVIPDHRVRDGPSAAPDDVRATLRRLEGL